MERGSVLQLCAFLEVASLLFPGLRQLVLHNVYVEAVGPSISRIPKLESLTLADARNDIHYEEGGINLARLEDLRHLTVGFETPITPLLDEPPILVRIGYNISCHP